MYLPIELLNIIFVYKIEIELYETYERRLTTFARAVSYKPRMRMISTTEAKHAFVRAFPHLIRYKRYVPADLEIHLGPPSIMGHGSSIWFFLERETSRIFSPLMVSYIEEEDLTQPPRTL